MKIIIILLFVTFQQGAVKNEDFIKRKYLKKVKMKYNLFLLIYAPL